MTGKEKDGEEKKEGEEGKGKENEDEKEGEKASSDEEGEEDKKNDAEGGGEDDEESEEDTSNKKNVRRDRRSRERRRRDRDRKRREEKKAQEGGSKKNQVADDSVLDKYEPADVMENHSWPMPLPEDAGRVRAYGIPGQPHEFWEYYEDYFKPIKDDALKMVLAEPDLEHDPCFRMPSLGPHYLQKKGLWEQEQEQQQQWDADMFGMEENDEETFLSKTVVTSSGRVVGGKRKQAEPPSAPPGGWGTEAPTTEGGSSALLRAKMVMRVLACFIQQDGVPSKPDENAEALAAAADAALKDGPDLLSFSIEQRMRVELTNLGLMETPDAEYDQPHLREDDQICAELRYQQEALRKHVLEREASATASRKALKVRLQEGMPYERILADVNAAARNMEQLLQPKFKLAKGMKPQDIKRAIELWDRAIMRYKAYMQNPNRRKAQAQQPVGPAAAGQQVKAPQMQSPILAQQKPGQPKVNTGQFGQRPPPGAQNAAKPAAAAAMPQVPAQQGGAGGASGMASKVAQFHTNLHGKK